MFEVRFFCLARTYVRRVIYDTSRTYTIFPFFSTFAEDDGFFFFSFNRQHTAVIFEVSPATKSPEGFPPRTPRSKETLFSRLIKVYAVEWNIYFCSSLTDKGSFLKICLPNLLGFFRLFSKFYCCGIFVYNFSVLITCRWIIALLALRYLWR